MGSSGEKYPEFFKTFCPDDCSENLRIPDAFVEHLRKKIPRKAVMRTCSGNCWPVEVAETEDGLSFQDGWSELVSYNSLRGGELMVFKYDGHHAFDIKILKKSGFEKHVEFSRGTENVSKAESKMQTELEEEEEEEEEEEIMCQAENSAKRAKLGGRGENYSYTGYHMKNLRKGIEEFLPSDKPFFVTKIRHDGRKELYIPNDIGVKFGKKIEILDPRGISFDGKIVVWKDGRHVISNFWKQLCKWNKVTKDDIVICELIPGTTDSCKQIKVQIVHPNMMKDQSATK